VHPDPHVHPTLRWWFVSDEKFSIAKPTRSNIATCNPERSRQRLLTGGVGANLRLAKKDPQYLSQPESTPDDKQSQSLASNASSFPLGISSPAVISPRLIKTPGAVVPMSFVGLCSIPIWLPDPLNPSCGLYPNQVQY